MRFVDIPLDPCVPGYPCASSPRFRTEIVQVDSGAEQVNRRWQAPLHRFTLPEAVREMAVFNAVRDHWLVMGGPARTWPWRDPLDFASIALAVPNEDDPPVSPVDQLLGVGDGFQRSFPISKQYIRQNGATQLTLDRAIELPVLDSFLLAANGVPLTVGYTVSRPGGVVTFDTAPEAGVVLTWGGLFDCVVRFEADDSFDGIVRIFAVSGFADLTLLECRSC